MDLFSKKYLEKQNSKVTSKIIKITNYELEEKTPLSLLEGFTTLRAVTFSSSFSMLKKLSNLGYKDINLIISLPEDFEKTKEFNLLRLLKDEGEEITKTLIELELSVKYLPRSHSKFYLLSNDKGNKRLILGSLNFSAIAWEGRQKEEVLYTDREDLVNVYEEIFDALLKQSKEIVSSQKLKKEMERKKITINIENLTFSPENVKILKELHNLSSGIIIKNFVAAINPQILKAQAEREKKKISKVMNDVFKIAETRNNILFSKPEKVSSILQNEEEAFSKSLLYDDTRNSWKIAGIFAIENTSKDSAINNLHILEEILRNVEEHGGTRETVNNIVEGILFGFAGSYLWAVRQKEDVLPENYPIFGILAGTTKAGKSLTLSIISMLTHGEILTVEYSRKISVKGYEYNLGNSGANIFEMYFGGNLPFAKGIYPILVNEVSENHLKDKKLYNLVKFFSNTRISHQHGVAFMSMNVSFCLPPEIARRVFFLEYGFSLKEHKKLEKKIRPLVKSLDSSLFFYFLNKTDPYDVEVSPEDPLEHARDFLSSLSYETGIKIPIPDKYLGDVESKGESELKHVFSLSKNLEVIKHPDNGIECYVLEKEKFRYPPPAEVIVEDKGNFYYLNKKKVDKICKREGFFDLLWSSITGR